MLSDNKINNSVTERFGYIDLIETIGILFIMLYHSTTYNYNWLDNSRPVFYFRYFVRTILSTCVPLFFFANGYLLFCKKLNLRKHIKKIIRYVILTFVWGLINIICFMHFKHEFLPLKEIVSSLWNWRQGWINHLWFMGTLVCIYVIFPVLKNTFDTNRKIFHYFLAIVTLLTFGNTLLNIFVSLIIGKTYSYFNFFNMFNPFQGIRWFAFTYFCMGG